MDSVMVNNTSQTIFGISHDALFTTITPISIFIFGYILNRFNDYRKERKRLIEVKDYFFALCDFLERPIRIQISVFNEYRKNISSKDQINFTYKDTSDLDIKNFSNVSHKDLYKILFRKKRDEIKIKTQRFNEILNSINFIGRQKENTLKNFNTFYDDFKKYESQWINYSDSILRNYDCFISYIKQNNIKVSEDLFLKDSDRIIHSWAQLENSSNMYIKYRELITQLRTVCNKHITDPRALSVLQLVVGATYAFNNINGLKELYSKFFENEGKELEEKYNRLMEAIKYFK